MIRSLLAAANLLQKTKRFRVVATIVVALAAGVTYSVWFADAVGEGRAAARAFEALGRPSAEDAAANAPVLTADLLRAQLSSANAWVAVGVATGAATLVSIIVIWLGLALTYLALGAVAGAIGFLMYSFESTRPIGQVLLGAIALTGSFTVILQAARAALGGRTPILAIARNVVDEAVRMKVSLLFILALVALLAAMPRLLDADQPLRYRVQSFLQYTSALTFWMLALLTLFFSVATVAFEQRDRLVWQTMVKPVTPLAYLAGKWLGVMTLNLALLGVASTGVFLFVEVLRNQPARGEAAPFLMEDGKPGVTPDRRLLETQVLAARTGATFEEPEVDLDRAARLAQNRLEDALQRDFSLRDSPPRQREFLREVQNEIIKEAKEQYRSVPPGGQRTYVFSGLRGAVTLDRPLTVRYRIDSGGNDPSELYRVTFLTPAGAIAQQTPLGISTTFDLSPRVIDENGDVSIIVINGDPQIGVTNPFSFRFPPDGFELLYTAGTYEANFLRITATQWIKLGLIAAVGIAAATFLSFPVACLLALLVLFAAESSSFLLESLEEFPIFSDTGELDWVALFMNLVARPIASVFKVYSELRPTAKLVDGRLIGWTELAGGVAVIGAWSAGVLAAGWAIFRKRELAIYSGH